MTEEKIQTGETIKLHELIEKGSRLDTKNKVCGGMGAALVLPSKREEFERYKLFPLLKRLRKDNDTDTLNRLNGEGMTPLYLAVLLHYELAVKRLIDCGADVWIKNKKCQPAKTPLDLAKEQRDDKMVSLLEAAERKINDFKQALIAAKCVEDLDVPMVIIDLIVDDMLPSVAAVYMPENDNDASLWRCSIL